MHVITRCITERLLRRRIINGNVPQKVCNQEAAKEIDEKSTDFTQRKRICIRLPHFSN
jgi:hypothetical protein